MADIERLIKKRKWTGKELGQIVVAKFYQRDELNIDVSKIHMAVKKISEDSAQYESYLTYENLIRWAPDEFDRARVAYENAQFNFMILRSYIVECDIAENLYEYMEVLKYHLTDKQKSNLARYNKEVLKRLAKDSLQKLFPEAEDRGFHLKRVSLARELILKNYRQIFAYNAALDIIDKEFNVPDLKKSWRFSIEDLECSIELINSIKHDLRLKIVKEDFDDDDQKMKLQILKDFFPDIEYRLFEIPESAIKKCMQLIKKPTEGWPVTERDFFNFCIALNKSVIDRSAQNG